MSAARKWWSRQSASHVMVETSPVLAVRGIAARRVTVHLPPGYKEKRRQLYPVLLALDGQTMGQWRLEEAMNTLMGGGLMEPAVVVAIPASDERLEEYGTAGALDFAGRGRKARAFQDFLTGEVLPWIRDHYRVANDAPRTGIFGASMGGLCAFDSAWRWPEVFGSAGIFSGSLWWRDDDSSVLARQVSRIVHRQVRAVKKKPALRLWFEAGTRDETADRDENGVIDAIQDTVELMDELEVKGFHRGVDMTYHEITGGEHNEATWAKALPEFLRWVLSPRPPR